MAEFLFDFCPDTRVAETIAPEEPSIKDFNGWDYTPRPVVPYRRKFKILLGGLRWYFNDNGTIDYLTNPSYNAGRLEKFYRDHRKWKEFGYEHEWMGSIELRFENPVSVPKAIPNSGGLIEELEIMTVHHNPTYGD